MTHFQPFFTDHSLVSITFKAADYAKTLPPLKLTDTLKNVKGLDGNNVTIVAFPFSTVTSVTLVN